jgi:hypothetical protein
VEGDTKGVTKGCKGTTAKGRKSKWECAMYMPCIYVTVLYVQWND